MTPPLRFCRALTTSLVVSQIESHTGRKNEALTLCPCTGIALNLAGIVDLVRGNGFQAAAFLVYGCFWCELAWYADPLQNLASAYTAEGGALAKPYDSGEAMFFLAMAIASFVLWLGTLKTNGLLILAVFSLIPLFTLFSAGA
jgi:succinate-acetate transporter protein